VALFVRMPFPISFLCDSITVSHYFEDISTRTSLKSRNFHTRNADNSKVSETNWATKNRT